MADLHWDEDAEEIEGIPTDPDADSAGSNIAVRIDDENAGERLDRFVVRQTENLSRNYVQHLIESGLVLVDDIPRRQSFKLSVGELVSVTIPPPTIESLEPEPIPLEILYEDRDLIVLNKVAGMVVHPAPGNIRGTLVNALIYHAPEISVAGSNRPGIVHRLDKDTSGLMVVAKSDRAKESLLAQWQARTVRKDYVALVRGVTEDEEATIDLPIARDPTDRKRMAVTPTGRAAVTHFQTKERFDAATLLDVELETGRTHQIRVHLNYIGHPIVGDTIYNRHRDRFGGANSISPRQFLHASSLTFELPEGRRMTFHADLPSDLQRVISELKGER